MARNIFQSIMAASALANDQLIASAGLTADEVQGLKRNQLVAAAMAKFSSAESQEARQSADAPVDGVASRGFNATGELEALATDLYNRGKSLGVRKSVEI